MRTHAPPYVLQCITVRCARREHYTVLLYYPCERHHASLGVLLDVAVHLVRVRVKGLGLGLELGLGLGCGLGLGFWMWQCTIIRPRKGATKRMVWCSVP